LKNLEGTRDYAVVTDDKREVAEVIAGFHEVLVTPLERDEVPMD